MCEWTRLWRPAILVFRTAAEIPCPSSMQPTRVSDTPLVSAIVPAYNAEAFIEQTLNALIEQTYANLEIIVVDDGSTDSTVQRAESLAARDRRVRIVRQANLGVAAARNRGIEESTGEFIAPVDADDIWFPDAVARLVQCLVDSDSRTGVAYGWWVTIDGQGRPDGRFRCSTIEGDVLVTLTCHNFLGNASSTMIRRKCFDEVGGYSSRFLAEGAQGCEDWDLYLRIADKFRFKAVPAFLFGYRKLATGLTADFASMAASHEKVLELVAKRHPLLPALIYRLSNSSFCLYLANESYDRGQSREGFNWLSKALTRAPGFTLLRPVFYLSLLKNAATWIRRPGRIPLATHANVETTQRFTHKSRPVELADIQRRRSSIFLRIALQNLLHRAAARLSDRRK